MPKLLSKFYKLSESWLKTAEIASGVYLTVLIMAMMVMVLMMMMIMIMPVLSDIFLLIFAFVSLYLALEVFKTVCGIKCSNNTFQFCGLYSCICVM